MDITIGVYHCARVAFALEMARPIHLSHGMCTQGLIRKTELQRISS